MAKRKATPDDVARVKDSLEVIAKAIDDAKAYMEEHPWRRAKEADISKAFAFSASLVDKIDSWTVSYMEKCGIMDVYDSINANKTREKKGQISGGIEDVLTEMRDSEIRKISKR